MATKHPRSTRGNTANYCELAQCRLPYNGRAKSKAGDGLYPIETISDEQRSSNRAGRVMVQYIGYSEDYNECMKRY